MLTATAALLLFSSAAALAHLCILPKSVGSGSYGNTTWGATTLNLSTPSSPTYEICSAADAADGASDGIINIEVAPGPGELALDVVYGQATETVHDIFGIQDRWKYDKTKLPHDPSSCICTPEKVGSCEGANYCSNYPRVEPNSTNFPSSFRDSYIGLSGAEWYIFTARANFGTLESINFRSGTVTFKNNYNHGEYYTFAFDTTSANKTSVFSYTNGVDCELLYASCPGKTGTARQQTAYKTRVTINPCYAAKPGAASATCAGRPGCALYPETADATLTFTTPSACYKSNGAGGWISAAPCGTFKVGFQTIGGSNVTKIQSQSPFTETTFVGNTIHYDLSGASDSCLSSDPDPDPSSGLFGQVTTDSADCSCNELPTPPAQFAAQTGDGSVFLSWKNPADPDFDGVYLVRGATDYPNAHDQGTPVYQGANQSFMDTGLTNGTPYYYSIFSHNTQGYYSLDSSSTHASATPGLWSLSLSAGWNFVSFPLQGLAAVPAELQAVTGINIFEWDGADYVYSSWPGFIGFAPGKSIMVFVASAADNVSISGGTPVSAASLDITLSDGWNLIGSPYDKLIPWSDSNVSAVIGQNPAVPLSAASSCMTGIIYDLLPFGDYQELLPNAGQALRPYKGYFIKAGGCTLRISK